MAIVQTDEPTRQKPLRLWPGVVIVILQWLTRFSLPLIAPDVGAFAVLSGPIGGLAVIVWWAFFSRAPWSERGGAILLMIVAVAATPYILHESVRTGNMAGNGVLCRHRSAQHQQEYDCNRECIPHLILPSLSLHVNVSKDAGPT